MSVVAGTCTLGEVDRTCRAFRIRLRNLRDRAARRDRRWRSVEMSGDATVIFQNEHAAGAFRRCRVAFRVACRAPHLGARDLLDAVLRHWPDAALVDGAVVPEKDTSAEVLGWLHRGRRGLRPLRLRLGPQRNVAPMGSYGRRGPTPVLA